jgi:hypothetical protein
LKGATVNAHFDFDALARDLARGLSRREALRRLGGGFAGALLAALGLEKTWGAAPAGGPGNSAGASFCRDLRVRLGADPQGECVSQIAIQQGPYYDLFVITNGDPSDCCRDAAQNLICCEPVAGLTPTCCNNAGCVDLQNNPNHCGACGNVCPLVLGSAPGQTAGSGGEFLFQEACCRGACSNPLADAQDCGACGIICAPGQSCAGGICTCEATIPCPSGRVCANGLCCPPGQQGCSGQCVDALNDPHNCGDCGVTCTPGQSCLKGHCTCGGPCSATCPSGQICCSDRCCDPVKDPVNCSVSPSVCPPVVDFSICTPGTCCGGDCTDTDRDPGNCGACGHVCLPGRTCCFGACADLTSDVNNCGACDLECFVLPDCCSGICTDTQSDSRNCGQCGQACLLGEICVNGGCVRVPIGLTGGASG